MESDLYMQKYKKVMKISVVKGSIIGKQEVRHSSSVWFCFSSLVLNNTRKKGWLLLD